MQGIYDISELQNIDSWNTDIFADYAGSDRKDGVIAPNGFRYLIKYAESHTRKNDLDTSYINNTLAEHLSSQILSIIGYPVHNTFLATRNDELVVCCKNFTTDNQKLIEFSRFLRKHYDSGELGRVPDYHQMQYVLHNDPMLTPYADLLWQTYCERFVGDALTGNFDRHMGNFGYLVSKDGTLTPSPIYDNGSTLCPSLSEHGMTEHLSSEKELLKRTWLFPKAALTVNGQKVSYADMMESNYDQSMTAAVCKIVPKIQNKMSAIHDFLESQNYLSSTRKQFYHTYLQTRFLMLLKPAYERCLNKNFNQTAYDRLNNGEDYTEALFNHKYDAFCTDREQTERMNEIMNAFQKK